MRNLMAAFLAEKQDIVGDDRTVLVIRALLEIADIKDIKDVKDVMDMKGQKLKTSASEVVTLLRGSNEDGDQADGDAGEEHGWMKTRVVGKILAKLRLKQDRTHTRRRDRKWWILKKDLIGLARAYGVSISEGDDNGRGTQGNQEPDDNHHAECPPSKPDVPHVPNVLNVLNVLNVQRREIASPECNSEVDAGAAHLRNPPPYEPKTDGQDNNAAAMSDQRSQAGRTAELVNGDRPTQMAADSDDFEVFEI
jgi:hypothetical protein